MIEREKKTKDPALELAKREAYSHFRDDIAIKCLIEIIRIEHAAIKAAADDGKNVYEIVAKEAYAFADAMIQARGRSFKMPPVIED